MIEDPGFVPKTGSRNQQRAVINELFEQWKFDEENFCVFCMVRKPLRSKHCKRCSRCVAKHDHHCPWIDNCVGANNLRHFVLYIICLEIGIILFLQLTYKCKYQPSTPGTKAWNLVNQDQ
jgi:palmitoyltransferase